MNVFAAELMERDRWDRLDTTLTALQDCFSLGTLADRAGELALAACGGRAAAFGWLAEDGTWVPSRRAGDVALLERPTHFRTSPVEAVVRCGGRRVGLLQLHGGEIDPDALASYADALGSMVEVIALRERAETQRGVLARLRGTLADPRDDPVTLLVPPPRQDDPTVGDPGSRSSSNAMRRRLTGRQREVLDLMSKGLTNHEIAERLVVAMPTVKSHVRAVLRAAGAVNRADAIARFAARERARTTAPADARGRSPGTS